VRDGLLTLADEYIARAAALEDVQSPVQNAGPDNRDN
jgi:hypothetical protein